MLKFKTAVICVTAIVALLPTSLSSQETESEQILIESAVLQIVAEIELPARAAGPLSQVLVRDGAIVEQDQLLATICDEEPKLKLEEAMIELEIAKQQVKSNVDIKFALKSKQVALADYRRAQQSNKNYAGVVSDREMDRLKLLVEKSDAELEKIRFEKTILKKQADLKEAVANQIRYEVERHRIHAAMSGQIIELKKRVGEWVNVADPVMKLVQLDQLMIEEFVPSATVQHDLMGAAATFRTDTKSKLDRAISGSVVFVSPNVDPLNSTVKIRVEFENPELNLRPGLKGTVIIDSKSKFGKDSRSSNSKMQWTPRESTVK